jgi:hypothetical protein
MKKDIKIEPVTEVGVAIAPEDEAKDEWSVYLVNLKSTPLKDVLISSKGYGESEGKKIRTSVLRQYFEEIPSQSCVKIEFIYKGLFGITNEFMVSFWQDKKLFDKKFVFVTESIQPDYFTTIPILNKRGVLIL